MFQIIVFRIQCILKVRKGELNSSQSVAIANQTEFSEHLSAGIIKNMMDSLR